MSGGGDQDDGCIVKLRGLPWSATVEEILKFFHDCRVKDGKSGIHMTTSREGRPSGEAFVEFEDDDDVQKACDKDREHMGNRYIEVFKVNKAEMDWVIKRCAPTYGSNEDGCVRLRGLPFGCSKEEIAQFFTGLEIVPNGITLLTDFSGRSSGEAYVQFVSKEVAEKALQKHREKIGHRYIEIFRSSLSEVNGVLGFSGNNNNNNNGNNRRMSMGGYSRPGPYDRVDRFGGGGGLGVGGGSGGMGGGGRFQGRGSRSFKSPSFSNNMQDYGPSPWAHNSHNNDMRGNYHQDNWSNNGHNGDMRGNNSRNYGMNDNYNMPYNDDDGHSRGGGGGGLGGGGGGGGDGNSNVHCVHMRGLPFKASENDIADFFRPMVPVNIYLLQDHSGRASGEADVEFASHEDAVRAMSKDKGHMQHRYIELFLNSSGKASNNNNSNNMNNGNNLGNSCYGGIGRRRI